VARRIADALSRWLTERDVLLVIDNCEHVVSAVADLISALTARLQADFESFSIDIERLIDAGNVVVMQGHYVGKGKATGESVRATVAHVLELADGKMVRFDQYVDSATINSIISA
jgi:ketosteroid isomerase-like protein